MFPIRDQRGRVIGFGGRVLDAGEPKYLNSPETALFHKGRELYGLYEVRQDRAPLTRLIVVEGYMDVVRLHQSGVTYAVATLGTATTPEHLKRAFRLVREIIFCFDGDKAGRAAAWRALGNALPEAAGRPRTEVPVPARGRGSGHAGRQGGQGGLRSALCRRAAAVRIPGARTSPTRIDVSHADGKARFVAEARPLLERVPAGPYRELLLDRLAQAIGVSAERFLTASSGPMAEARRRRHAAAAARRRASARRGRSAGRGSLVRQAVQILLHFPAIAARVGDQDRSGLDARRPSRASKCCANCSTQLQAQPAQHAAQLLERWRDQPLGERLRAWPPRPRCWTTRTAAATNWSARCANWLVLAKPNCRRSSAQQEPAPEAERSRLSRALKKAVADPRELNRGSRTV